MRLSMRQTFHLYFCRQVFLDFLSSRICGFEPLFPKERHGKEKESRAVNRLTKTKKLRICGHEEAEGGFLVWSAATSEVASIRQPCSKCSGEDWECWHHPLGNC